MTTLNPNDPNNVANQLLKDVTTGVVKEAIRREVMPTPGEPREDLQRKEAAERQAVQAAKAQAEASLGKPLDVGPGATIEEVERKAADLRRQKFENSYKA